MAANVGKAATRSWARADRASLLEQHHLMSSVVSLFALNPLVLPAVLLAWLLTLSKKATAYPVVRTSLYLMAVLWTHMVIGGIRAVTPLCFAFAGIVLAANAGFVPVDSLSSALYLSSPLVAVPFLFALVEVAFFFWTLRRAARLQRRVVGPELGIARRWLTYRRVELSSPFVLPMAMPRTCLHYVKHKHLRVAESKILHAPEILEGTPLTISASGRPDYFVVDGDQNLTQPHPVAVVEHADPSLSRVYPAPSPSNCTALPPLSPMMRWRHAADARLPGEEIHPLQFLKGWFYNIPMRHIKHDNLMVFFAENSMGLHLHELSAQQRSELEEVVAYVQRKLAKLTAIQQRKRQAKQAAKAYRRAGFAAAHERGVSLSAPPLSAAHFRSRAAIALPLQAPLMPPSPLPPAPLAHPEPQRRRPHALASIDSPPSSRASPALRPTSSVAESGADSLPSLFLAPFTSPDECSGSDSADEQPTPLRSSPCGGHATTSGVGARRKHREVDVLESLVSLSSAAASAPISAAERDSCSSSSDSPQLSAYARALAEADDCTTPAPDESGMEGYNYTPADSGCTPATDSTSSGEVVANKDTAAPLEWGQHLAQGTLPQGYTPGHDPMKLNLATITFQHRPLAIYAGISALGFAAGVFMRWLGFSHHRSGRLGYWHRRAVRSESELLSGLPRADPLIFIHGIGIGPTTYVHLLQQLIATRNAGTCRERSVYVLELPYISMRLGTDADNVPRPLEHVEAVADMLYRHEMDERDAVDAAQRKLHRASSGAASSSSSSSSSASAPLSPPSSPSSHRLTLAEVQSSSDPIKALIMSHSYGTFVSTWITKYRSDLISAVVLVDPVSTLHKGEGYSRDVCFMVYDPALIYNFLYRTPFSLVTRIYNYFTSKELGIAHTLCRHFWWYENCGWREELERLGMSAAELEQSMMAERDMCVAALPYHDEDDDEMGDRNFEPLSALVEDPLSPLSPERQQRKIEGRPRSRSRSDELDSSASAGYSATLALQSPHGSFGRASTLPVHSLAEHPLCPASSPGVRAHVYLAANDDISPTSSIRAYLAAAAKLQERKWGAGQAMLRCTVFPSVGHAEALFLPRLRNIIVEQVQTQPSDAQLRAQQEQRKAAAMHAHSHAQTAPSSSRTPA